jgi:hypothetical protein
MAEVVLREVRQGKRVLFLFQGHPTVLNYTVFRALEIAELEGAKVKVLPGISSINTLLADLRIDVDYQGCQILKATALLVRPVPIMTTGHLIILSAGRMGDQADGSQYGPGHAQPELLFQKLSDIYGPDHACILYWCRSLPTASSAALETTLGEALRQDGMSTLPTYWTLYVPPQGTPELDTDAADALDITPYLQSNSQRSGGRAGYGPLEQTALKELDRMDAVQASIDTPAEAVATKLMGKVVDNPPRPSTRNNGSGREQATQPGCGRNCRGRRCRRRRLTLQSALLGQRKRRR